MPSSIQIAKYLAMSKVKRSLKIDDFYRSYKIRCKEKKMPSVTMKEYRQIVETMGKVMSDILLNKGIIGMPWHIGDIFLKKRLNRIPVTDVRATVDARMKIYNYNEHSDGYVYIPFWMSPERRGKKRKQWCFSAFRATKRRLKVILVNKEIQYPDFAMVNKKAKDAVNANEQ